MLAELLGAGGGYGAVCIAVYVEYFRFGLIVTVYGGSGRTVAIRSASQLPFRVGEIAYGIAGYHSFGSECFRLENGAHKR